MIVLLVGSIWTVFNYIEWNSVSYYRLSVVTPKSGLSPSPEYLWCSASGVLAKLLVALQKSGGAVEESFMQQ